MNKQQEVIFLNQIFNTLSLITTQGENTIVMGDCLKAMKQYIQLKEKEAATEQEMMAAAQEEIVTEEE